jgi:hypothetical protein
MNRARKPGEQPLGTFALVVIGIEMLAIAAIICYAFTEAANVGHAATWFGEGTMHQRGPKGM